MDIMNACYGPNIKRLAEWTASGGSLTVWEELMKKEVEQLRAIEERVKEKRMEEQYYGFDNTWEENTPYSIKYGPLVGVEATSLKTGDVLVYRDGQWVAVPHPSMPQSGTVGLSDDNHGISVGRGLSSSIGFTDPYEKPIEELKNRITELEASNNHLHNKLESSRADVRDLFNTVYILNRDKKNKNGWLSRLFNRFSGPKAVTVLVPDPLA